MKSTIFFDLDGTVLASQRGIYASLRYALERMGLPSPDDAALRPFLGPPLQEGFAQVCGVPPKRVAEAVQLYREYYRAGGMLEAEIYEGIPALLTALRAQGARCYITTSKPELFAKQILAHFGVDTLFDGIYGSLLDNTRSHKEEVLRFAMTQHTVLPEEAVLVGDRCYDVRGAKAVGIACVGVLYGYGDEQELREAGADALAANVHALEACLLSL